MQETPLLPIPYNCASETGGDHNKAYSIEQNDIQGHKDRKLSRNNVLYYILSVVLCLVTVFVSALSIFSGKNSILDTNKIIEYIAGDFLGLDLDNGSIFDLWMPDGDLLHGGSNDQTENNTTNNSSTNKSPDTSSDDTESTPPDDTQNIIEDEIPSPVLPDGEYPIISADLSSATTSISNMTTYEININEYANRDIENDPYILKINTDMTLDPLVLIVHTHGTEAFSEEGSTSYSETSNIPRSTNTEENIISVGKTIAETLNKNGIPTIHCEIMHDKESYQNSYERSAQTIKKYLERYPSIKYVFDVHRDSIVNDQNIKYRPITEINGEPVAQIMFVMGSNVNTPDHVNWESNLTLAIKATEALNSKYNSLTRTISLRASSYNQQFTTGSLLVEVGSCGNTLSEAKRAGVIFANEISEMIKSGW